METAGITDIRNAFAGIFQQAAGLEKPDAVQVVHDRTAGGIAEKAAQMIFGDIKMGGNIIKAPDCTVILINIGDDFCNERGIFRTSLFFRIRSLKNIFPAGIIKQGQNSHKGGIGGIIIIFMNEVTDLKKEGKSF